MPRLVGAQNPHRKVPRAARGGTHGVRVFQVLLINQDEAVDIVMEKERRRRHRLSVSMASDPVLTMKQRCSTETR